MKNLMNTLKMETGWQCNIEFKPYTLFSVLYGSIGDKLEWSHNNGVTLFRNSQTDDCLIAAIDKDIEVEIESNGNKIVCNKDWFDDTQMILNLYDMQDKDKYTIYPKLLMSLLMHDEKVSSINGMLGVIENIDMLLTKTEVYSDRNIAVHELYVREFDTLIEKHVILFKDKG